ncbi:MAG: tetratricopeptide repeat protein [Armatimonadetes bacterium]|nr:tetratricopeptide repeat protein [Armatimonadota bacterium]
MSFERLATELSAAVAEGDWKRAISFGDKMHALLPASIPDDFPWSWDVAWSWRAAIGDLYMYDLQFEQAAREYSRVLAEAPESKVYYKDSGARQSAAYGLARALASLGRYKEALVWLRLAPNQLLSGCANCMEVEDRLDHVISTVWEKANLGLDLAADELESIMNGNFQPVPPGLNGDHTDSWIRRAKVEAAFALGQLYLRNGSPWTAIGMFEFVVADGGVERYEVARIAQTYIMRLPGPVPLTQ